MQTTTTIMKKTARFLLLLVTAAFFTACRSTTRTHIYLLTADDDLQRLPQTDITFELRPITLPDYLNRREFVKRIGEDEICVQRSCLWAETSEHSVNSVFTLNLKALLGDDNVLPYGSAKDDTPILHISVRRLEVQDDVFLADFQCRLQRHGKTIRETRLVWKTDVAADVPAIKYYKKAMSEMARQTAAWLTESSATLR